MAIQNNANIGFEKQIWDVALVIMQNFMDANLYFKGLFHKIVFKWI